jgi:small subunit ribosomal protein S4
MKLFLKGDRCFSEKCAVEKRRFAPGQHGKRRTKVQGYGIQLREKQKVKRIYGMLENQFHLAYQQAVRKKGITGEVLLQLLERRLDNVVFRLGFASSRWQARQIISHGHVRVNDRKVDVGSYLVKAGDTIGVKDRMKKNTFLQAAVDGARGRGIPPWLSLDSDGVRGTVTALPTRDSITLPIQEQMIIELYSK